MVIVYLKTGFIRGIKDPNSYQICLKNTLITYLKAKNFPNNTLISNLNLYLLYFWEINQMLEYIIQIFQNELYKLRCKPHKAFRQQKKI